MDGTTFDVRSVPHPNGLSVLVCPEKPEIDIVFIHGFTGDPRDTWATKTGSLNTPSDDVRSESSSHRSLSERLTLISRGEKSSGNSNEKGCDGVYWPRDLLPAVSQKFRVLTYGYDTHIRHSLKQQVSQSTVYDIAWGMLVDLEAARRSEPSRPLVFVAHSLGGIVVKEALRRSRGCDVYQTHLRHVYNHTEGVIFFGTPHGGADPRGLIHHIAGKCAEAAGFSANEQVMNSLLPSSERLRELRDEFGPMARQQKWIIHSFQEQYGVKLLHNKKVVEDTASCLNDPGIEVTQHIARNHMEMCRFGGLDDAEFGKFCSALNRIIESIEKAGPKLQKMELMLPKSNVTHYQREEYLNSLLFDQIEARHATIKPAHAQTCRWLLDRLEYRDWLNDDKFDEHHGFLWLKGKPATGKSTIMKFILARAKETRRNTTCISFFFNARGETLEKSTQGMYRSLLYQLFTAAPRLQSLFEIFRPRKGENNPYKWDFHTLQNIFSHAVEKLARWKRKLMLYMDALDECEEEQVREMVRFFEELGEIAAPHRHFHICFSSRHYPHITIDKGVQITLESQDGHYHDISMYLNSELKIGSSKKVQEIKSEIMNRASGIFLWVVLVVAILNKEFDRGRMHALRKRLDEIPNKLDDLFEDILTRDDQNMDDLILCLQWILYARQPLKREELYFAIIAGVAPEDLSEWDREEITEEDMERFILSSSKGLAEMTKSESQTVQFIHESVSDYLRKGKGLDRLRADLKHNFPGNSHEQLKRCCQNYISPEVSPLPLGGLKAVDTFEEGRAQRVMASERFPFLKYAVENVMYHADNAEKNGISQETFFEGFSLNSWIILHDFYARFASRRYTDNSCLLKILLDQNAPTLALLEFKRAPNSILESRYGISMLALLSRVHVTVDPGERLSLSSSTVQVAVDLPLTSSTWKSNDLISREDGAVLSLAAHLGHASLIRIILSWPDVDINIGNKQAMTPLQCAASRGHEEVVRLLLQQDGIEINRRDAEGQTALLHAAKAGHLTIVKFFLARDDVQIDLEDYGGRTPLIWAVIEGHTEVVEVLLKRPDVNPNAFLPGRDRTLLSIAAGEGQSSIVALLLARGDINIDLISNSGSHRTPLSYAAEAGHVQVVELLLAYPGICADARDIISRTPLSWAAGRGHDLVAKLLLEHSDVAPDTTDKKGQTPL